MSQLHGDIHFSFAPDTYILPTERDELIDKIENDPVYKDYSWIVKPASVCSILLL